jgi:hypothetical protein
MPVARLDLQEENFSGCYICAYDFQGRVIVDTAVLLETLKLVCFIGEANALPLRYDRYEVANTPQAQRQVGPSESESAGLERFS